MSETARHAPEISRFIGNGELFERAVLGLYALAGAKADSTTTVSANEIIELCSFITALMIQSDAQLDGPERIRVVTAQVGRNVHAFVRAINEHDAVGAKPVMAYYSEGRPAIHTRPAGTTTH